MDGPLAFSVAEACSAARIGRTSLYQAIRAGQLRALKNGRRILATDLHRYLENLPAFEAAARTEMKRPSAGMTAVPIATRDTKNAEEEQQLRRLAAPDTSLEKAGS
jgi:excisionase family DNA binding protein